MRNAAPRHALPGGRSEGQQSGQNGDVGEEGDEHASPGDQSEFGEPRIIGRQERKESDRRRDGAQRQRATDLFRRLAQRRAVVAFPVVRLPVAQPEMDAEIHAEPNEEDGESHRNQVELPDGERREAGRPHQSHDQGEQHRPGQRHRAHPDEQEENDQGQGKHRREAHPFLDALELFLGQGRRSGEADAHPVCRVEFEVAGYSAEAVNCLGGRLQRAEIKRRLD